MIKHRFKNKLNKKAIFCDNLMVLAKQLNERGFDRLADHVTGLLKIALKK